MDITYGDCLLMEDKSLWKCQEEVFKMRPNKEKYAKEIRGNQDEGEAIQIYMASSKNSYKFS